MNEQSLDFNFILKTEPESGEVLEITGFDMDFDIIKTNKAENNKAGVTIWNLDDTKYQSLVEKDSKICIYAGYGEEDPVLVFRGYINKITRKKSDKSADTPVYLEIMDGRQSYTDAFINKCYRDEVSSTVIIKDCIAAMGLDTGVFSSKLPEKIYKGYKAVGFAHTVLQKICRPIGAKFSVQNNFVHIVSSSDEPVEETAVKLNSENSSCPHRTGTKEIVITTGFIPYLSPNGTVKCEFTEFSGLCLIKRIHSFGNNYGKAIITEITV